MDAALASQFARDGYVVLERLFDAEAMADWKRRIIEQLREGGWNNDPSGVRVWMVDAMGAFFREQLTCNAIAEVLASLWSPRSSLLSVKPVFKNSSVRFGSPWHHDWAYWGGTQKVSLWIALDDASESNGCLKMIPGSHKLRVEMERMQSEQGFAKRVPEGIIEGLPVETINVKRGDAVLFNDLVLHASHPNASGDDRWSFIATYRDDRLPDTSTVWHDALPLGPNFVA